MGVVPDRGPRLQVLVRAMRSEFPGVARWEESGDILQEVLLKVWLESQRWDEVPTVDEFVVRFVRTARSVLIDRLRHYFGAYGEGANHASDQPGDSSGASALAPVDPGERPLTLLERAEIHVEINRLPKEEWSVFELRYYQQMSWVEVVATLGVPERTAKRRYLSARNRLRERLQGKLSGLEPGPEKPDPNTATPDGPGTEG